MAARRVARHRHRACLANVGASNDSASSPTVVVALDEETYRTPPFKGTPIVAWTDEVARVLTAVLEGGAKIVGFDIVFSTTIEASDIEFQEETIGERMRGFDRDFLRALNSGANAGKIVLGELQADDIIAPSAGQRAAVGQMRNIRSLNVYGDDDGVVRRVPLALSIDGMPVPSMPLELASRWLRAAPRITGGIELGGYTIRSFVANAMTSIRWRHRSSPDLFAGRFARLRGTERCEIFSSEL